MIFSQKNNIQLLYNMSSPQLFITSVGNQSIQVNWINAPVACNRSTLLVNDTDYDGDEFSAIKKYDVSLNNLNPANPEAYNITGLRNGHTYLITYIQTQDSAIGSQGASNTVTAIPYTIPAAPTINTPIVDASGRFYVDVSFGDNGGNPLAKIEFVVCSTTTMNTFQYDISGYDFQAGEGWVFDVSGGNIQNYVMYEVACYVINLAGQSSISNTEIAYPTDAPNPPRNVRTVTTGVTGTMQVNWAAPIDCNVSDVNYYVIDISGVVNGVYHQFQGPTAAYDGGSPSGHFTSGETGNPCPLTDISYSYTGLTNGEHYQFRVYAHNLAGGYSLPSNTYPSSSVAGNSYNFPFAPPSAPLSVDLSANTTVNGGGSCPITYNPSLTCRWSPPAAGQSSTGSAPLYYQVDISNGINLDTIVFNVYTGTSGNDYEEITYLPYNSTDTSYGFVINSTYGAWDGTNTPIARTLTLGSTYKVFVRAINDDCYDNIETPNYFGTVDPLWGPYGASNTEIPFSIPPAPTNEELFPGDEKMEIYWDQAGNNGSTILGFIIDISGVNFYDGSFNGYHQSVYTSAQIGAPVGTQYYYNTATTPGSPFTGLLNGWTYNVKIYQVNAAGASTCFTSASTTLHADPPIVEDLTSNGTSTTTGNLTWTVPDNDAWTSSGFDPNGPQNAYSPVTYTWTASPTPIIPPNRTGYILYTFDPSSTVYGSPIPVSFVDSSNANTVSISNLPDNGTTLWGIATRATYDGVNFENSVIQKKFLSLAGVPTIVRIDLSGSLPGEPNPPGQDLYTLRVVVNNNGAPINQISAFAANGTASFPYDTPATIVQSGNGGRYSTALPESVRVYYFTYTYQLITYASLWTQPYQVNVANETGMTTVTNNMDYAPA